MKTTMYLANSPKFRNRPHRDCPTDALPIDFQFGGWIEPCDYTIVRVLDQEQMEVEVDLSFNDKMRALYNAYEAGEPICYDGDPTCEFPDSEGYGGAIAEIFWAVKYRGGISTID